MEKGTGETEIPAGEGKIVRLKGGKILNTRKEREA